MTAARVPMRYEATTSTAAPAWTEAGTKTPLSPRVRLLHCTRYRYDRPVWLSAHDIRLRPVPQARTPIESYALRITPAQHELKWHHDVYGNWVASVLFSHPTPVLSIEVEFVATLAEVNPFDFSIAGDACQFPFAYSDADRHGLMSYLATEAPGPRLRAWLERMRKRLLASSIDTVEFLVPANRWIADDVRYVPRVEPGIQDCEQTLAAGSGSCRDSARLLMQVLRHAGIAARFVSGYLVELAQSGGKQPGEEAQDNLALHAWCEAYLPGAGWIGLDPTSGLLAAEGHIALACAALPESAAAVSGSTEKVGSDLSFEMRAVRLMPIGRAAGGR